MYRTFGQMVAVPFILPPYFERIIESKGLLGYWCLLHFSVILQLYLAYKILMGNEIQDIFNKLT